MLLIDVNSHINKLMSKIQPVVRRLKKHYPEGKNVQRTFYKNETRVHRLIIRGKSDISKKKQKKLNKTEKGDSLNASKSSSQQAKGLGGNIGVGTKTLL